MMPARPKTVSSSRRRTQRRYSQPSLMRQAKSYHTFTQQGADQYSGNESPHSSKSDTAAVRSSRTNSFSQVSTGSSSSSCDPEPTSNTSRLTLDPILNTVVRTSPTPVERGESSDTSGPIGNSSTRIINNNASVDSPTCSTDEAENIRAVGAALPLMHHPPYHCQEIPQESTEKPLFSKGCLCRSLWKGLLCAILLASAILSCLPNDVTLDKVTSSVFILQSNKTLEKGILVEKNATDFTIWLEAIDIRNGTGNIMLDVQVPNRSDCVSHNLNITKWTHHPHFALVRCWSQYKNPTDTVAIKLTNRANHSLGLAIDINTEQSHNIHFISVFVVLLLLHLSLLLEVVKPMVVVLVAAGMAKILYDIYEVQVGAGLANTVGIVSGSITDQLLLVAGLMIMVNALIRCGFYSSLIYKISAIAGYRWKRGVYILLALATLFSMLFGRMAAVQILVPLSLCYSEAYNLSSGRLICILLVFINTGNLLLPFGNEILMKLSNQDFSRFQNASDTNNNDKLKQLDANLMAVMAISGVLSLTLTAVLFCFRWLSRLPATNAESNSRDFRKVQMLSDWKERTPALTKAGIACRQLADSEEKSLIRALFNTADGQARRYNLNSSDQNWKQDYHRMIISAYYFMSDWQSFFYCGGITTLAVIGFPIVSWLNPTSITPGVISAVAAVWLIIVIDNEQKTVKSLDWSTLLFLGLYRYTMQTLLSGTIWDRIGLIYEELLRSGNHTMVNHTAEPVLSNMEGTNTVVIWLSWLLCSLIGVENFSPDMPIVFSEILSAESQIENFTVYCLICQVIGATLSGNTLLFSSLSNVMAKNFAAEHGVKISPWKFLRFGLPITILTTAISTVVVLIGYLIVHQ